MLSGKLFEINLQFILNFNKTTFKKLWFDNSDNFFLGGPLNVRGFDLRGIGPHSDGMNNSQIRICFLRQQYILFVIFFVAIDMTPRKVYRRSNLKVFLVIFCVLTFESAPTSIKKSAKILVYCDEKQRFENQQSN